MWIRQCLSTEPPTPLLPVLLTAAQRAEHEQSLLDARDADEAQLGLQEAEQKYRAAREAVAVAEAALSSARRAMIEAADALTRERESDSRRVAAREAPELERKARHLASTVTQAVGCSEDDAVALLKTFGPTSRGIYLAINWASMQVREGRPIQPIDESYGRGH